MIHTHTRTHTHTHTHTTQHNTQHTLTRTHTCKQVAKSREEAAAKPEGLAEDSLLSVLTDEDMSVLREYLDDHKQYPDRQGASSRSLASDALEAAKAEHEGRVQVVE